MTKSSSLRRNRVPSRTHGFTLIEMAVVVAVIGLLLGSLLVPLATQVEERRISDVRRTLDDAKEALIGYVIANGRLPCPATQTSNGIESPAGGGACVNSDGIYRGYLPAVTLGITPTDAQGYAIDPWNNRIRYAVTTANGNAFTTANGINTQVVTGAPTPDLQVCSTAVGVSGSPPSCAAAAVLTASAPAVIYSTGPNGASGGASLDESENPNATGTNSDRLFVSRPPGTVGASGGEFDDIVTWLSPNLLYARMVAAGKLP
jgi:prepilin-type N-terminal cleavage/methylation domain-containing protein